MTEQNNQSAEVAFLQLGSELCNEVDRTSFQLGYDIAKRNKASVEREKSGAEPVACRWKPKNSVLWIYNPTAGWLESNKEGIDIEPLYTTPPTVAVMLERAAEVCRTDESGRDSGGYYAEIVNALIPLDSQAALEDYVRERCMAAIKKINYGFDEFYHDEVLIIVNSVIEEMRGGK